LYNRNGIADVKKQGYSEIIAKSNKIKTTWNFTKKGREKTFRE